MGDNWINTHFLGVAIWVVFPKYAKALTVFVTAEALSLLCLIVATDSIPSNITLPHISICSFLLSLDGRRSRYMWLKIDLGPTMTFFRFFIRCSPFQHFLLVLNRKLKTDYIQIMCLLLLFFFVLFYGNVKLVDEPSTCMLNYSGLLQLLDEVSKHR